MSTKIHILLPVHNRRVITEKCIECLVAQSYSNFHLILIDDGSTDGTEQMVRERVERLTVINGKGSWWWAGSLQQGIDWLKRNQVEDKDIIVFINDDVTFENNFLQMAVNFLEHQSGILLPQVFNKETGMVEETGVMADFKKLTFVTASSPEKINCLPTRGLFLRMSDLRRIGDFYPRLLPHYLSDYEFTIRAYRLGISLKTSPDITLKSNDAATGYRSLEGQTLADFFKKYFSIKSASNPIYWSTFVLLASPKLYIPWNLFKVWGKAVAEIGLKIIRIIFNKGGVL